MALLGPHTMSACAANGRYPLVTMEMTRRIITNVAEAVGTRGPMGHIIKLRHSADAPQLAKFARIGLQGLNAPA